MYVLINIKLFSVSWSLLKVLTGKSKLQTKQQIQRIVESVVWDDITCLTVAHRKCCISMEAGAIWCSEVVFHIY